MLNRKERANDHQRLIQRHWLAWAFICISITAILFPALGFWAKVNQDEMQILDLGRSFLNPDTDWSMNWLVHESRSLLPASYIGPALQEWAFQLFLPSITGTRFSSLAGALLASTLAFGWLLRRRMPAWGALLLATIFLLDPILNASYREGRVDSWALAACLGSCWLLRIASDRSRAGLNCFWHLNVAGFLAGLAPFVWPTAFAVMPLIFVELFYVIFSKNQWKTDQNISGMSKLLMYFVMGGVVFCLFATIPILIEWDVHIKSLIHNAIVQDFASVVKFSFIDLYYIHDRMILILVAAGLLLRREIGLIIALTVAIVMMYQTMIYPMRVLYLLPYWMAIIAGGIAVLTHDDSAPRHRMATDKSVHGARRKRLIFEGQSAPRRRLLMYSVLVIALAWNVSVSLIQRPLIAHQQSSDLSIQIMENALREIVGEGPIRVLTTEWDVYPVARSLDWKIYNLFGSIDKSRAEYDELLKSMSYAIIRDEFSYAKGVKKSDLERAGFEELATIEFETPMVENINFGPFKIKPDGLVYHDLVVYKLSPQ